MPADFGGRYGADVHHALTLQRLSLGGALPEWTALGWQRCLALALCLEVRLRFLAIPPDRRTLQSKARLA